jgi:hypothetical protein
MINVLADQCFSQGFEMKNVAQRESVTNFRSHPSGSLRPNHPAWIAFIRFCGELQHGQIEILRIQDGLPVLAEVTRKKVKFAP